MAIYAENIEPPYKAKIHPTSANKHFFKHGERELDRLSPVTVSTSLSRLEVLTEVLGGLQTDGELKVVVAYLCQLPRRCISYCVYMEIVSEVLDNYMEKLIRDVDYMGGSDKIIGEGLEAMFGEEEIERDEEKIYTMSELTYLTQKMGDLQELIAHFKKYIKTHYGVVFTDTQGEL